MNNETFLVTGALGCIGAWVLRNLVDENVTIVAADLATNPVRPRLLMSPAELERITFAQLDITDSAAVRKLIEQYEVTRIIHLAALQVPFCKADPVLGAQVNVVGTTNIFEAARHYPVQGLTYASSVAVLGPADYYPQRPVADDAPLFPKTLYGVYKQANEQAARVYWEDWQVSSVGLRPFIVYGVGRDQGLTSDPAKAILAAVAGQPFQIKFDGLVGLQYASDVARMFIGAARAGFQGAAVYNLRNDLIEVADFVAKLKTEVPDAQITYAHNLLPFPADLDDSGLQALLGNIPHTPLETAIQQTLELFRRLLAEDRIDLGQLTK